MAKFLQCSITFTTIKPLQAYFRLASYLTHWSLSLIKLIAVLPRIGM